MAIKWHLRAYITNKHHIYTATELQKKIIKETGVVISLANLCKYLRARPIMIRPETMQIICTALGCTLHDLLSITPKAKTRPENKKNFRKRIHPIIYEE